MTNEQIKVLYEESDLTPAQIKEIFPEIELEAIKSCLVGCSAKYRRNMVKDPQLFSEDDERTAVLVMGQLLNHENENIQFRSAKFIINERKGRHDRGNLKNLNINVNLINEQMKRVKEAKQRALSKVIDVPAEIINE